MPFSRFTAKAISVTLLILSMTFAAASQSIATLKKQANKGDANAQAQLAEAYHFGKGISKDDTQAAGWFRKAAEQGNASAEFSLGYLYAYGHGVTQDYKQAASWYLKAADQGFADAENNLGYLYANGQGVPKDAAESAHWFRKAAEQGVASAQDILGLDYAVGAGVPQDYAQAAIWFRKSAEQGDASAQAGLGVRYANGQGLAQDYAEAYFWFELALSGKLQEEERANVTQLRDEAASHLFRAVLLQMQERIRKRDNGDFPLVVHIVAVNVEQGQRGVYGGGSTDSNGNYSRHVSGGGSYTWKLYTARIEGDNNVYGLSTPRTHQRGGSALAAGLAITTMGLSLPVTTARNHWLQIGDYRGCWNKDGTLEIQFTDTGGKLDHQTFHIEAEDITPTPTPTSSASSTPPNGTMASLTVESNTPGADIEIDGAFVGNTPSTVSVTSGSHQIAVKKKGFTDWSRILNVTGGAVHLNAELEQEPAKQ